MISGLPMMLMIRERELAFRMMAKKIGLTDRRVFDAAYSAGLKLPEPRLDIKPVTIQATLDEIAKTDPRAKQVAAGAIDRQALPGRDGEGRDGSRPATTFLWRYHELAVLMLHCFAGQLHLGLSRQDKTVAQRFRAG